MQAVSKYNAIRRRVGHPSRRRTNAGHKVTLRPHFSAGHGFLRHRFLPVWDGHPLQDGQAEIEAAFYQSLANLEALYKFKTPRSRCKDFPANIATDFETARQRLEKVNSKLTLFISVDEQQRPCVCTTMPYNTASTLFYIPVKPLHELLKKERRKKAAELLLSIFAYLHLVLDVPYYRDKESFLYGCYQVMKEQFDQYEDEGEDLDPHIRKRFKELESVGDKLYGKIKDRYQLEQLVDRVNSFVAVNKMDGEILKAGKMAVELYRQYPDQSLFGHIPNGLFYPQEFDRITSGQYISFYWSDEPDYIGNWIFEYVNGCFENCGAIDEPAGFQVFNSPQKEAFHDLGFPTAVFEMIETLCTALNDVK